MAAIIPKPAPRNRHTFPEQAASTWRVEVGGTLDDGATPVETGNVSVGDQHVSMVENYGYRFRYIFEQ